MHLLALRRFLGTLRLMRPSCLRPDALFLPCFYDTPLTRRDPAFLCLLLRPSVSLRSLPEPRNLPCPPRLRFPGEEKRTGRSPYVQISG